MSINGTERNKFLNRLKAMSPEEIREKILSRAFSICYEEIAREYLQAVEIAEDCAQGNKTVEIMMEKLRSFRIYVVLILVLVVATIATVVFEYMEVFNVSSD